MEESSILPYLPAELISTLLRLLPKDDLLSLRLVSRSFLHLVSPLIFSKLTIEINVLDNKRFHENLWLIKRLATTSSLISPSVQTLHLNSLFSPRYQRINNSNGSYSQVFRDSEPGPDEDIAKAILLKYLAPFLSKLQNLETFVWRHDPLRDPSAYLSLVANSASSLPKLQDLSIQIKLSNGDPSKYHLPPLHSFKNLLALSVISGNITDAYCEDEIRPAAEASPGLDRFSLRLNKCSPNAPLQTILGKEPRSRLVDLRLENVPFPSESLGYLCGTALQSLSLSTGPSSRGTKAAWSSLWVGLQNAEVRLSSLSVAGFEGAIDDMFSYLLSYSTLERLRIGKIQMDQAIVEDAAGETFWGKIVPQHKDHLIELTVHPVYEGLWCYGPSPSMAIQQCSSLQKLSLCVCQVDSAWFTTRIAQLREKGVGVPESQAGWGLPERCPALIVSDFASPLLELSLRPTYENKEREIDIMHLNNRTRRKGSPKLCNMLSRLKNISAKMKDILYSMTVSSAGARNWPAVVNISHDRLLKRKENTEIGVEIWMYRSWRYEEMGSSQDETETDETS